MASPPSTVSLARQREVEARRLWAEFDAANRRVGEAMTAYLRFVVPGRDGACWCGAALAAGRVYCAEHAAAVRSDIGVERSVALPPELYRP